MCENNATKWELTRNDVEVALSHMLKIFPRCGHTKASLKAITPDYLAALREVRMTAEDLKAAVLRHLGASSQFPTIRDLLQAHEEVCRAAKSKVLTTVAQVSSPRLCGIVCVQGVYQEMGFDPLEAAGKAKRGHDLYSPAPPEHPEFEPGCYGRLPRPCTAPGADGDGFCYEQYRRSLPKAPQALAERHEQTVASLEAATRAKLHTVSRLTKLAQIEFEELGLCGVLQAQRPPV